MIASGQAKACPYRRTLKPALTDAFPIATDRDTSRTKMRGGGYATARKVGGARKRSIERSATGCASDRTAMRRTTTMAAAGTTRPAKTRTASSMCEATVGNTVAANTTITRATRTNERRVNGDRIAAIVAAGAYL